MSKSVDAVAIARERILWRHHHASVEEHRIDQDTTVVRLATERL